MGASVILTVGNSLMGDDAAGPHLAALLAAAPAAGWDVIDGSETGRRAPRR
jgi:hydrogenase 3 maturation protease